MSGKRGNGEGSIYPYRNGFAAYVWPYVRPGFGVEANLGLVFARHQELATTAFLYSGWREDLGQSYAGLSLTYCLRWY